MQNYLSELLTDESAEPAQTSEKEQKLEKLLQNVAAPQAELPPRALSRKRKITVKAKVKTAEVAEPEKVLPVVEPKVEQLEQEQALRTRKSEGPLKVKTEASYRKGSFQALFFEVAGLVIAVPLIELGGIHNMDKTSTLMGKPPWFKGVMIHREEQIQVVDTALWVMPEKCDQKLKESLNYQYVVMLSNTHWGLMAESLVDTVTLEQEDVKWLDAPSKRPWLAGLVKDRMCALLDVVELTKLLDQGMSINQE
ncbi:chemotaxis protein CheW [Thalassomonas actiniarum]|uniref:Chemotaxis protein CheW n=2 Tax=Thalassomonas actiniarum TaxID=485447 RepID=A0AAF0C635_9GAMM|nr:chemotaxis protein CheW [Thalassomonas actiniarum]